MDLRFVPAECEDFRMLTQKLDEYYLEIVGEIHLRYAPFNHPTKFASRIVAYDGETPVGCGCWKVIDDNSAEIKRIYVLPNFRRNGIAGRIIFELEADILRSGRTRVILETARTTEDSAALYTSLGYQEIDYYGSPAGAENCRCFEKQVSLASHTSK